jgi:hypothetical protein
MLINLMLEDASLPEAHGALHLSRLLPPKTWRPWPRCCPRNPTARTRRPHIATARAFIPRAQRMARDLGLPWPKVFAAATARHLEREMGVRVDLG